MEVKKLTDTLIKSSSFAELVSNLQLNTDEILYTVGDKLFLYNEESVNMDKLSLIEENNSVYLFDYEGSIYKFYSDRIIEIINENNEIRQDSDTRYIFDFSIIDLDESIHDNPEKVHKNIFSSHFEYNIYDMSDSDSGIKFMCTNDYLDGWETSSDDIIGRTIDFSNRERNKVFVGIV